MKQLLILIILGTSFSLCGQMPDDQWYIKSQTSFRDGSPNTYLSLPQPPQPVIGTQSQYEYFIEGITYPFPLPSNEPPSKTPRNDLFIIYADGSYFNSYKLASWPNRDGQNSNGVQQMESYKLETDRPIDYLYYTNVYDGDDDPNALVTVSPTSQFTGVTMDNLNQLSSSFLSINHTLVKGKDFTLILDLDGPRNSSEEEPEISKCAALSICWESTASKSIKNYIEPSFVFNDEDDFTLGSTNSPSLNSGCARFSVNSIDHSDNVFINLHVKHDIPDDFLNKDVEFRLQCGTEVLQKFNVPLVNAHDPNFTDLVCIREDGDFYYANYVINCTNDITDPDVSTSATFSFVPPVGALSFEVSRVLINNNVVTSPTGYQVVLPNNPSNPNFSISTVMTELSHYNSSEGYLSSSLNAEICIKFPKVNGTFFDPNDYIIAEGFTMFGNDYYPIHANLSLCEQHEVDYNSEGLPILLNERQWCGKENNQESQGLLSFSYCDCKCGEKPPCDLPKGDCCLPKATSIPFIKQGVILGLLGLGLIVGAYLIFRK